MFSLANSTSTFLFLTLIVFNTHNSPDTQHFFVHSRNRLNAAAAAAAAAAGPQTTIGIGGPAGEIYPHPLPPDWTPPFGAPPLPGDLRSRMLDFGGPGGVGGRISPVFQGGPPPRVPNEFGGYQPEWNPEYQPCGGYYQGSKTLLPLFLVTCAQLMYGNCLYKVACLSILRNHATWDKCL